jgi:hypothetical protein
MATAGLTVQLNQPSAPPRDPQDARNYVAYRLELTNFQIGPWNNPQSFPKSELGRRKLQHQAKQREAQNLTCLLCERLPQELVLETAHLLTGADLLSLHSTCWRIRGRLSDEVAKGS